MEFGDVATTGRRQSRLQSRSRSTNDSASSWCGGAAEFLLMKRLRWKDIQAHEALDAALRAPLRPLFSTFTILLC